MWLVLPFIAVLNVPIFPASSPFSWRLEQTTTYLLLSSLRFTTHWLAFLSGRQQSLRVSAMITGTLQLLRLCRRSRVGSADQTVGRSLALNALTTEDERTVVLLETRLAMTGRLVLVIRPRMHEVPGSLNQGVQGSEHTQSV